MNDIKPETVKNLIEDAGGKVDETLAVDGAVIGMTAFFLLKPHSKMSKIVK